MHITFHDGAGIVQICSLGRACPACSADLRVNRATVRDRYHDHEAARSFLRQRFLDACEVGQLRAALVDDVYDLARRTDSCVFHEATHRLTSGAWRVMEQVAPLISGEQMVPALEQTSVMRSARSMTDAVSVAGRAFTPARMLTRTATATATAMPPMSSVSAPLEWPQATNQIIQAKAMEQGSRYGQPLYCICQKRDDTSAKMTP